MLSIAAKNIPLQLLLTCLLRTSEGFVTLQGLSLLRGAQVQSLKKLPNLRAHSFSPPWDLIKSIRR